MTGVRGPMTGDEVEEREFVRVETVVVAVVVASDVFCAPQLVSGSVETDQAEDFEPVELVLRPR